MDAEILAVDRLIAQQALSWPEIRRLMTVPGVNLICAASSWPRLASPRGSSRAANSWRTSG
jgi:transposase